MKQQFSLVDVWQCQVITISSSQVIYFRNNLDYLPVKTKYRKYEFPMHFIQVKRVLLVE